MGSENNNNSKHNLYDIKLPFPFKLHEMLTECSKNGTEDIVSWQPHGKAFRVHKPQEFTDKIMQRFFHQSQYKSFQRQLHIYGFHRISKGRDKGSYYHPMFLKGSETISLRMTRCKIKGSMAHSETEDPDFYHDAAEESPIESEFVRAAVLEQELSRPASPQVEPISISSFPCSTWTWKSADNAMSKAFSLPVLSQKQQQQKLPQILRNVSFSGNPNKRMLRETLQPRPFYSRHTRRDSLLAEGDEVLFAGKKFHFVQIPMFESLPRLSQNSQRQYTEGAMGA